MGRLCLPSPYLKSNVLNSIMAATDPPFYICDLCAPELDPDDLGERLEKYNMNFIHPKEFKILMFENTHATEACFTSLSRTPTLAVTVAILRINGKYTLLMYIEKLQGRNDVHNDVHNVGHNIVHNDSELNHLDRSDDSLDSAEDESYNSSDPYNSDDSYDSDDSYGSDPLEAQSDCGSRVDVATSTQADALTKLRSQVTLAYGNYLRNRPHSKNCNVSYIIEHLEILYTDKTSESVFALFAELHRRYSGWIDRSHNYYYVFGIEHSLGCIRSTLCCGIDLYMGDRYLHHAVNRQYYSEWLSLSHGIGNVKCEKCSGR